MQPDKLFQLLAAIHCSYSPSGTIIFLPSEVYAKASDPAKSGTCLHLVQSITERLKQLTKLLVPIYANVAGSDIEESEKFYLNTVFLIDSTPSSICTSYNEEQFPNIYVFITERLDGIFAYSKE